jgi:hypothetical protein
MARKIVWDYRTTFDLAPPIVVGNKRTGRIIHMESKGNKLWVYKEKGIWVMVGKKKPRRVS